jgi:hypothetical protein
MPTKNEPWIPVTLALPPAGEFVDVMSMRDAMLGEAVLLPSNVWWCDEVFSGQTYLVLLVYDPTHWRRLDQPKYLKMKE